MTAIAEALGAPRVGLGWLCELEFPEGAFYVWDGVVPLEGRDGRTWLPVGHFGAIQRPRQTEGFEANELILGIRRAAEDNTLDLSAFVEAMNAERRRDVYGLPMALYFQLFDPLKFEQIGLPEPEFVGAMSHIDTGRDSNGAAEILLTCEGDFAEGAFPAHGLYTDADQKARYPDDRAFELIAANANRNLVFPRD